MKKRTPDYRQFLKVVTRQGRPDHLPAYEHIASPEFIDLRMGVPFTKMDPETRAYWQVYVDFWIGMGFDVVPIEVTPNLPLPAADHGAGGHASEAKVVIRNREDFARYPWPTGDKLVPFHRYELAAECLPDGARLVAGACMGPFEWVSTMLGIMGMSYLLLDDPDLVGMVFANIAKVHTAIVRRLATLDAVCALRQGDDLGFRTSTFLSPEQLRQHVFPIYRSLCDIAHAAGKPFVLHSCGNLDDVYEDIIACGVDAKHSFEEAILPVEQFKQRYGKRMTPLGGLDVDMICRAEPDDLRRYVRHKIETCFGDGHWAIGTGNSLTGYMPIEKHQIVLDEMLAVAG